MKKIFLLLRSFYTSTWVSLQKDSTYRRSCCFSSSDWQSIARRNVQIARYPCNIDIQWLAFFRFVQQFRAENKIGDVSTAREARRFGPFVIRSCSIHIITRFRSEIVFTTCDARWGLKWSEPSSFLSSHKRRMLGSFRCSFFSDYAINIRVHKNAYFPYGLLTAYSSTWR